MTRQFQLRGALAGMVPVADRGEPSFVNMDANFRVLHDRLALLEKMVNRLVIREQRRLDAEKVPTTRQVIAGTLLTGGGALSADVTLNVDETAIDHDNLTNTHNLTTDIDHDQLLNYAAGEHRTINDAGTGTTDLFSASEIISRLAGKAATSHTHAASDIASGTVDTARLGSGTASASTYLRGDQSWAAFSGQAVFSSEDGIIAGADSQGDYPVTANFIHVATVDATGKSITLPAVTVSAFHVVANDGANSMNIYPPSGEYIDSEAQNASIALAASGRALFWYQTTSKWRSVTF